jgi:menaquinone-dependent protoporphyrinogen IX oxidase
VRVAVVYFPLREGDQVEILAKALAEGLNTQGHQVDLINGASDQDKKLIIYQYIAVGTCKTSFLGKIDGRISHFLASQGTVQGKKGFAFVVKKMFGSERSLLRLMSAMEKEGMILKSSEVFSATEEARETGKRLHVTK